MNKFATEQLALETHVNAGNAESAANGVNDKNRLSAERPKLPADNGKHQ